MMPRTLLMAAVLAAPASALAQTSLLSNGSASPGNPGLSTGVLTESGAAVPPGIDISWSEVQALSPLESNAVAGFSGHSASLAGAYRFADDFTVTGTRPWRLTAVRFFAYQPGSSTAASPFNGVNLRIWSGRPDLPASAVLFGDASTNRFASSSFSRLYRVFHSVDTLPALGVEADGSRPIWSIDAVLPALELPPGTYWLDFQITCADPAREAFVPPVTFTGQRTRVGANALHFRPPSPPALAGSWLPLLDPGKPAVAPDLAQELPFILIGYVVPPSCPADIASAGNPDPNAGPDGFITGEDFDLFVQAYFSEFRNTHGVLVADVADGSGQPLPDGFVTGTDFDAYVQMYFLGC